MTTLNSPLSVVSCHVQEGVSHNAELAVDPVLCLEFLDDLQNVRQIPICGRHACLVVILEK